MRLDADDCTSGMHKQINQMKIACRLQRKARFDGISHNREYAEGIRRNIKQKLEPSTLEIFRKHLNGMHNYSGFLSNIRHDELSSIKSIKKRTLNSFHSTQWDS